MRNPRLQALLRTAEDLARERRHALLTAEHLLLAAARDPDAGALLSACGAGVGLLRVEMAEYLETHVARLPAGGVLTEPLPHDAALDRALRAREPSEDTFDGALRSLLAALLQEERSFAAYCLLRQGITARDLRLPPAMPEAPQPAPAPASAGRDAATPSPEEALAAYAEDLTERARQGRLDPLVGRERELERTLEVLCRRRKNNPLFVGDAGVGKTALAEGLALRIAEGRVPARFRNLRIYALDMGRLMAGTRYRGDFESRLKALVDALRARDDAVLFIDEIHTLVGAGATSDSALDASNLLKPALALGRLRCMGSTTHEEFRRCLEKDRALARRFQRIDIGEPSPAQCVTILNGLASRYAGHHGVSYSPTVLRAVVDLSVRYLHDRMLPDKAIDVMDECGATVSMHPRHTPGQPVRVRDVEQVVARMAGVPTRSVSLRERVRLASLEEDLRREIFGQDEAVRAVSKAILRSRAGFGGPRRPAGSFLFCGPTGVGKTELARVLARLLGLDFLRFDMSEYMEGHSVSRLIGAPPGYVGHDQGGLLTEGVRRSPHCVLLLDELEKAHPDVFNILLQVMDDASLTDALGRRTDFRHVILIMTSNAGAREMQRAAVGFAQRNHEEAAWRGRTAVDNAFAPEFRNRLDGIVSFQSLSPALMDGIVRKFLRGIIDELKPRRIRLSVSDEAVAWLAREGYDPAMGARPLRHLIRTEIEDRLAAALLFGSLRHGGDARILNRGASLALETEGASSRRGQLARDAETGGAEIVGRDGPFPEDMQNT